MGSNNGQSKWMRKSKTMKLGLNGNKVSEATIATAAVVQFIHLQQQSMLLMYYCDHVIVIMRDKLNNRGKNCNKVCPATVISVLLYYCFTVLLLLLHQYPWIKVSYRYCRYPRVKASTICHSIKLCLFLLKSVISHLKSQIKVRIINQAAERQRL